jgi:spermidine synthase
MQVDMAMAPVTPATRGWRWLIVGLFGVSGISGLLYEVAWTRLLTLLFGDTVLAVSTVLASFMAGLALGSFWSGRRIDRRPRVLPVYASLEIGIGLAAVLLPLALQAVTPVYVWLHQQLHTTVYVFSLLRFVLAFGVLLVPTTLMGATLPVLSRYLVRSHTTLGWNVGLLYALNTAGAVVGCFAAGYLLLGHLGLAQTVYLGAALNLVIALLVWMVRRRAEDGVPALPQSARTPVESTSQAPMYSARVVRLVLWSFALSGFAALSYEVIWTRALTFFIGNSTYAFSAMLTTFLCGLALGSLLLARHSDRRGNLLPLLGGLHLGIGIYGLLTIPILGTVFYSLDAWWEGFSSAYWGTAVWLKFAKTFTVILLPTLCMGGTFPLVSKIVAHGPHRIARSIGDIYAVNTLGAIVGSWVAGFVFMPLFGMHRSLVLTALLSVGLGGVLLASGTTRRRLQIAVYAGVLGLFVAVHTLTPVLRFADIAGEPEKDILHYEEGVAGVVKVATDIYDRRLLSINGWSVAGTGTPNANIALVNDYPEVQKMLAHLPMLLHPAPRQVLVIGFGAGGTSWSMSLYDLARLDIVEFVPGVIRAARFFPEVNHNVLADARLRVTIDDGRNYLLVTPQTYDVVSVDTLDPKHAGNGNLYTQEFYALSKRVLNPGGIFVQWLPYHQVDNASLKMIARTFLEVYPHATLWLNRFKGYALLLGTLAPLRIDVARLEGHFQNPILQRDLAEVHVATPWQFLEGFTMHSSTLRRYTAGVKHLNTYNHPYVEFFGLSWHDPVEENLAELAQFADDVTPLLWFHPDDTPERRQAIVERLRRQQRISRYIFRGYLANWRRRLQEGTREYRKALQLDAQDEGVKFALGVATVHKQHALETLQQHPEDVKALSKLGYIAWNEQRYDKAIRRFQQVLAIQPQHAAAYVHLGVNYTAQEDFAAAIAAYQEAARLNPEFVPLVRQSLNLIAHLQHAKEQPDDPVGHFQLGYIYGNEGRFDAAITAFEKVVELAPDLPQGWLNLALNYEAEARDADALLAYGRVLALEPGNARAQNNYEKLALKTALALGQSVQMRLAGNTILEVSPQSAASYYELGLRYLRNDEPESAIEILRQALQLQTEYAPAYVSLGLAYASLGAHEKATDAYRQAIAHAPHDAMVYAHLAASYEASGDLQQALAVYRQALQRDATLGFVRDKITALTKRVKP